MDRQVKTLISRATVLVLIAAVLLIAVFRGTPCLFLSLTGLPCPTCGMTRAWLAFFRLEIVDALLYHPMFWGIPVLGLLYLLDGLPFPGKRCTKVLYLLILAGFAITYLINIVCFLSRMNTV